MGKKYSKKEILEEIQDMRNFYKRKVVNYRGTTSDSKEYYTEVVAEWILKNIYLFNHIKPITREKTYKVDSHDGKNKDNDSNREEEKIAMKLFDLSQNQGKVFDIIGKIIDYQTPLKDIQTDKAGKIDLLAYNEEEKTLRILELKKPDSKETMLRCVLEAYTYLKVVDKDKLLKDFELPEDTILKTCPFVFVDGAQYKEIQEDRKYLKELMKKLDVEPIYLKEKNGEYEVMK
ncbi:hypothetical protein HMPREF9093_00313 [Fusobacterium sp. oral taxon 370 str. F0437]|uniref:hypothetical protein n=1 Tax=Fusobacterium sp. oral taxon 370 TaxID=712288 RepID=UPI000234A8BB|nr:hypothetical protein [Fusobacterium sp. oral taxon 370]EHI79419.1 hypothetical protein HMPREF9093_00313 [Fusobacterium sp. oral taxon 370 str. F0437]